MLVHRLLAWWLPSQAKYQPRKVSSQSSLKHAPPDLQHGFRGVDLSAMAPFAAAYCCITPDFLADFRLPVHFAPAAVTLNASCSPAACTSSVSLFLMFP